MPRKKEPARLYLDDTPGRTAVFYIRDYDQKKRKPIKVTTGCGKDESDAAERELERYLAEKQAGEKLPKDRAPDQIYVADIISFYAKRRLDTTGTSDFKKTIARPTEFLNRLAVILDFFGEMQLDEVDSDACKEFTDECESHQSARRRLEDLKAAINYAYRERKITRPIPIWLPHKADARSEHLTRKEVADLLRYAWRKKGNAIVNGKKQKDVFIWRHLCRYILSAVYTGTRKARIYKATFKKISGHPFIDLSKSDRAIFNRLAPKEIAHKNKQAPPIIIPPRLTAHMRRWEKMGATYLVEQNGRPVDPSKFLRQLFAEVFPDRDDLVIHTYRHTAATWLMEDVALPLKDIAVFLGMSVEMLSRVYGQSRLEAQVAIGDTFSNRKRATTASEAKKLKEAATVSDRNNVKQSELT